MKDHIACDLDLATRYRQAESSNDRNRLFDVFWQRHGAYVQQLVAKMRQLCPRGFEQDTFVSDLGQQVLLKLMRNLGAYEGRGPLHAFLWFLVKTCAIDERRRIISVRQHELSPYAFSDGERVCAEDEILDSLAYRSTCYTDSMLSRLEEHDQHRVLWSTLCIHASTGPRQARSAWAVSRAYFSGRTRSQLSEDLGVAERTIYRILGDDLTSLQRILIDRFNLSDLNSI